jgi:hypothetical protein
MLAEYALIPDIFEAASYSSPEVCDIRLQYLKEALLEEALIRDLWDGGWSSYISHWLKEGRCHLRAKELLKKLHQNKRICRVPAAGDTPPETLEDWCKEAIASHQWRALQGVIVGDEIASQHSQDPLIASINRLASAHWWRQGHSVRLCKRTADYLQHLKLVLNHANSILFIDPYLDPTQPHYKDFWRLLNAIQRPDLPPLIELHIAAKGTDRQDNNRRDFSLDTWKSRFNRLSATLHRRSLSVEVFVWDNFHDRYIISNLVGINLNGGLDTHPRREEQTTWNRLSRQVRDDVQREFTPNSGKHTLLYRFAAP